MLIYVSAPARNGPFARLVHELWQRGHQVEHLAFELDTYIPVRDPNDAQRAKAARAGVEQIDAADLFVWIAILPSTGTYELGGHHAQLGVALMTDTPVVVWGSSDNVFAHHADVRRCGTLEDVLEAVDELAETVVQKEIPFEAGDA